jgi:hypothetical protein
MNPPKKGTHTFITFRAKHCAKKKVWVPKKRNSCFFGPNIVPKKKGSKKNMILKKKGIRTFSGQTLRQKSTKTKKQYDFGKKELN